MIIDNRKNGTVGDALKKYLSNDASLSLVTNKFSIFAYKKLAEELNHTKDIHLLMCT